MSNENGAFKAHAMVMQGSRNFFQWRVKRSSKAGNCTMRLSADGDNFAPIIPVGQTKYKFPCGRVSGYESAEYILPKAAVNNQGAVLQLEFETDWGTTIQCSDIIIQKIHSILPAMCDPKCQNGGICQNSVCKCSKMFLGETCETRVTPNGSLNLILYVIIIVLTAVGIGFMIKREQQKKEFEKAFSSQ